ncbi:hypothetical protein J4E81_004898 [Alternaria sp. BMP 2799]|nr:hypothetical protein J4E81_004898 [Alternaria sp. BMP 2799]
MSWKSVPPVLSTSPWHIAAVDAEGAAVPGHLVLSEWGTVHLRSVDVENLPYDQWHKKIRCSMIVDQQYIHTSHPYCPRPHSMYLWCLDQTVRIELEAKALRKAIMNDLSVEGYTRTHYSKWPANIRAAESAPAPVVEEAAPPSAPASTVLERALIVNRWTNTCDLILRHIIDS